MKYKGSYSIIMISMILILSLATRIWAQDYQINFTGTGAGTTVDSVKVENLSQGKCISLSGLDTLHLLANVGISEVLDYKANGIHIYPNPTSGSCSLGFTTTDPAITTVFLYNMAGKILMQNREFLLGGHHTFRLDGIKDGTYLVKVVSDKCSYSAKIVCINNIGNAAAITHFNTTLASDGPLFYSQAGRINSLRNHKSAIDFPYTSGDLLKLTGKSGVYRTVVILVPAKTQTVSFNFVACTDADNNNYSVVQIGTQLWMAENLKTTKYRNGDNIPVVTNNTAWENLTTGAYSWYNNDAPSNKNTYGALYNWYATNDSRNLAPVSWHIPSDNEWTILANYLGDASTSGGKIKETGYTHWKSPNSRATNETGFTALPGGYRFLNGTFDEIGGWGIWWCSTSSSATTAPTRAVFYNYIDFGRDISDKNIGFSLRCIKD